MGERRTYGSVIIAALVAVIFLAVIPLLFETVLAPVESLSFEPRHSPTLAMIYRAVRSIYLIIRGLLTTETGLVLLLALALVVMVFEEVRRG